MWSEGEMSEQHIYSPNHWVSGYDSHALTHLFLSILGIGVSSSIFSSLKMSCSSTIGGYLRTSPSSNTEFRSSSACTNLFAVSSKCLPSSPSPYQFSSSPCCHLYAANPSHLSFHWTFTLFLCCSAHWCRIWIAIVPIYQAPIVQRQLEGSYPWGVYSLKEEQLGRQWFRQSLVILTTEVSSSLLLLNWG